MTPPATDGDSGAASPAPSAPNSATNLALLEPGARVDDMAIASDKLVFAGGVKTMTSSGDTSFPGFVRAVHLIGGDVVALWSGGEEARSLALTSDGRAAFATFDFPSRSAFVRTVDLASGAATTVASWETATGCTGVAATPNTIFWTSELGGTGTVSEATWNGTNAATLAEGESCPGHAAIVSSSLVWLSGQGIESIPLPSDDGTTSTTTLPPPANVLPSEGTALSVQPVSGLIYVASGPTVFTVTLDGAATSVFDAGATITAVATTTDGIFVATTTGVIFRRTADGTVTTVVSGLDSPMAVAADDHAIYWAETGRVAWLKY